MVDRAAARVGRPAARRGEKGAGRRSRPVDGGRRCATQRPLYKYSWPDGQQVYVNGDTAEVVQYTTTSSRFWAYLGAIPHWLYFTPLRKHQRGVVLVRRLVVAHRHDRGADGRGDRDLDVLAAEALPPCGRADQHSVPGLEALAHDRRALLRRRHHDLGVQRPAVDGAVSDHGPADGADGRRRTARRRPQRRRRSLEPALRGAGRCRSSAYDAKHPRDGARRAARTSTSRSSSTPRSPASRSISPPTAAATRASIPVHGEPMTGFDAEDVMRVVREAGGRRLAELRAHARVRRLLPRSPRRAPAAGDLRPHERRRGHALLHRSEDRARSSAATARATG